MIPTPTQIYAERVNFERYVHIHMRVETSIDRYSIAKPVLFEALEEDTVLTDPMLRMNPEQAQMLMDALWSVGIRPTQGKQSEGQIDATEKHLADMRAIVFSKLKVPKQ